MSPLERRILTRYEGIPARDVARIERVTPVEVRAVRARHKRSVDDGQAIATPTFRELLSLDDVDRMMRSNRSVLS